MDNKEIYLTDPQYLKILHKIQVKVKEPGFKPNCFDSTALGDKYTESNCGLCCDDFTDKETAMWPNQFPERKSLKYRLEHHKCPFDERVESGFGFGMGCFYKCYLFSNRTYDVQLILKMVASQITEAERW